MAGNISEEFVRFTLEHGVLRFGEFRVKSGRLSPYFFNAGLFNTGASLGRLAQFYARALAASGVAFDMLFGPAYKGIPLATATASALAALPDLGGRDVPFAFNRKEAKDHGEGDRKSDVEGQRGAVRVDLGGRQNIKERKRRAEGTNNKKKR